MKKTNVIALALLFAAACTAIAMSSIPAIASAVVTDLRCEYRVNPLGIDAAKPRLSWKLETGNLKLRGIRQTAYQVLVASSENLLKKDQGDFWDSGKVTSDQSIQVEYADKVAPWLEKQIGKERNNK